VLASAARVCAPQQAADSGSGIHQSGVTRVKPGYLYIETSRSHPGLIRLVRTESEPDPEPASHSDRRIGFVARFNDSEAAMMHVHEVLKRRLIDQDDHFYRASPERAIAAVRSLDLRFRQVYLDCDLDDGQKRRIDELETVFKQRRQRINQVFEFMGYAGLALLLFNMFILSWM
jgi:hypothetical protein